MEKTTARSLGGGAYDGRRSDGGVLIETSVIGDVFRGCSIGLPVRPGILAAPVGDHGCSVV